MFEIIVQVQIEIGGVLPEKRLQEVVEWVLRMHDVPPGTGVSIVITDDEESQRLNSQFRGVDAPTDVLSFPADDPEIPEDDEEPYLGDLILALPYIVAQAEADQHSVEDELILAVIHGTLHLLGYDHDTAENQAAMWEIQAQTLQVFGVNIIVPLFEFPADSEEDSF